MNRFALITLLAVSLFWCIFGITSDKRSAFGEKCLVRRAAFDVGSTSTKMKVAEVNVCLPYGKSKPTILFSMQKRVDYKAGLKSSADMKFSPALMEEGIGVFRYFKRAAEAFKPAAFSGVATSAFRSARNEAEFRARIERETGIYIVTIDQTSEGRLGFLAAAAIDTGAVGDLAVWDIGGSSMQITTMDEDDKFIVYRGNLASIQMKEHIIKFVQNKDPKLVFTPNPINRLQADRGIEFAEAFAHADTSALIKAKLRRKTTKMVGIGPFHNISIGGQTGGTGAYTAEMVHKALEQKLGDTDKDIGGGYAETQVSNLILVSGFMNALQASTVELADVNLADGVLLDPQFWKTQVPSN